MLSHNIVLTAQNTAVEPAVMNPESQSSISDEDLLIEIQKKALNYFINERNPENGLIRDWASNNKPIDQHIETTGKWLGADCGDVKPIPAMMNAKK